MLNEQRQTSQHAEAIRGLLFCKHQIRRLLREAASVTIKAQLMGVSHQALMNHRAASGEAIGQSLDESLLCDVIQHGETAGERAHLSVVL